MTKDQQMQWFVYEGTTQMATFISAPSTSPRRQPCQATSCEETRCPSLRPTFGSQ
jgi:hypothetical protein